MPSRCSTCGLASRSGVKPMVVKRLSASDKVARAILRCAASCDGFIATAGPRCARIAASRDDGQWTEVRFVVSGVVESHTRTYDGLRGLVKTNNMARHQTADGTTLSSIDHSHNTSMETGR